MLLNEVFHQSKEYLRKNNRAEYYISTLKIARSRENREDVSTKRLQITYKSAGVQKGEQSVSLIHEKTEDKFLELKYQFVLLRKRNRELQ